MTTTNTDTAPIICRTLRQLDALVAERLFGWRWVKSRGTEKFWFVEPGWVPPKEWDLFDATPVDGDNIAYGYGPDLCPHYTTWAGLEAVISKVESAGYSLELTYGNPTSIHAAIIYDLAPAAFNLAALAAFGCRVQLELGGE